MKLLSCIIIVFSAFSVGACNPLEPDMKPRNFKKMLGATKKNGKDENSSTKSCSTDLFVKSVQPILENSCLSCHGKGGEAEGFLYIHGPKASEEEALVNAQAILGRSNLDKIEESKFLKKVNGESEHGSNTKPVISEKSKDYATLLEWFKAEQSCRKEEFATNLARSSGEVLQLRLAALFPNAAKKSPGGDFTGLIPPTRFDVFKSVQLDKVVAAFDRNYTPPALIALRQLTSKLCMTELANSTLFKIEEALLAGETAPSDDAVKLALSAIRRAWLYPYSPKADEVAALVELYRESYNTSIGAAQTTLQAEASARQTMCMAVLAAPQFLLGNAGPEDVVRRVALEIGHVLPKWEDYAGFQKAKDKAKFIRRYTEKLQTSGESKKNYIRAVQSWHAEWFGLREFIPARFTDRSLLNGIDSATGFSVSGDNIDSAASGFAGVQTLQVGIRSQNYYEFSESCTKGLVQAFNPVTTEVVYQHKNPAAGGAWQTIGGWKKVGGFWTEYGGSITLHDGTTKAVSLRDLSYNAPTNGKYYYKQFDPLNATHIKSGLQDTPVDGFAHGDRRVLRYSTTGLQDGYSEMRLWYTGEKVKVCNTYSRMAFTCAHRALTRQVSSRRNQYSERTWTPAKETLEVGGDILIRDSFVNPKVIENFRCGVPDTDMISREGQPDYNENIAYPVGAPGSYNELAINMTQRGVATKFDQDPETYFDNTLSASREARAQGRMIRDLRQEPYRLISHILDENMDYRLLLTADFTYGGKELELLFRAQGFILPGYPNGYTPPYSGDTYNEESAKEEMKLSFSDFLEIPLPWVKSRYGCYSPDVRVYCPYVSAYEPANTDYIVQNKVPPRVLSGVLTQAAFINPIGAKARTLAARIFTRLMCGLPNDFLDEMDESEKVFSEQFVPTKENASGAQHVDRSKGCYSCHVVLDPVAAILNTKFLDNRFPGGDARSGTGTAMHGELMPSTMYGIRGGGLPASGAFLGKPITGIRDLAQAVANSRGFLQCTVKKTFTNIFGREPNPKDMKLIVELTKRFKKDLNFNYNRLVQEMVASPDFMEEY